MLMQTKYTNKAPMVMLFLSLHFAFVAFAFTGIVDEKAKNSKFTLNSLNKFSKKGLSLSAIKSTLHYKGLTITGNTSSSMLQNVPMSTMMLYNNGNTTYIYPYKIKVKVPKFRTPQDSRN